MSDQDKSSHPGMSPVDDTMLTRESWKIFQIMAEFVEGFERMARVRPSVSIFGSARTERNHPYYLLTEKIAAVKILTIGRIDQRIIGGRIDFNAHLSSDLRQAFHNGA